MERKWRVLLGIAIAAIAAISFWASPIDSSISPALIRWTQSVQQLGAPAWFRYGFFEFWANVMVYLLAAVLVCQVVPRRWWWLVVVAGFVVSTAVEVVQATMLPGRVGSPRDVLANTIGAALGVLASRYVVEPLRRRRRSRQQD